MYKANTPYICTASKSQFYIRGKVYLSQMKDGAICIQAEDGHWDRLGKTLSQFREVKKNYENVIGKS